MTYDKDLEVLTSIRNKITLGIYHSEEAEALDDAISAIQTLKDMGDTMNTLLRTNHKGEEAL